MVPGPQHHGTRRGAFVPWVLRLLPAGPVHKSGKDGYRGRNLLLLGGKNRILLRHLRLLQRPRRYGHHFSGTSAFVSIASSVWRFAPRDNLTVYRGMPAQARANTCTGCGLLHHELLQRVYLSCDPQQRLLGGWNPELRDAAFHVAKTGKAVVEGKGTNRKFLNWDNLVFLPGQMKYPPLLDTEPVNTKVVIGPNSEKACFSGHACIDRRHELRISVH